MQLFVETVAKDENIRLTDNQTDIRIRKLVTENMCIQLPNICSGSVITQVCVSLSPTCFAHILKTENKFFPVE
jgi:hypothetical protein